MDSTYYILDNCTQHIQRKNMTESLFDTLYKEQRVRAATQMATEPIELIPANIRKFLERLSTLAHCACE